ncbi:MAG: NRDE family protein, partial [Casimicrobiaceae bacterium]
MCLAVFALDAHSRYRLVVAANRDEFYARPAAAAHWWHAENGTQLLGGRDLEAGGTWFGVNARGRWAFVTNVREPGRHDPLAPSRGRIVPALLADSADAVTAMHHAVADAATCNGFNAVAGDAGGIAFGSNRQPGVITVAGGVHGVSNATLDTPWPKLVQARERLARFAAAGTEDAAPLWELLADRTFAPDPLLPHTGVAPELERMLSAAFIVSPRYGTRASTLLTVDLDGRVWLAERSFDAESCLAGEVEFRFRIPAHAAPPCNVRT